MLKPFIKRIRMYPVKALDPIEVTEVEMGIRSLKNDRTFAMLAEDGSFVNGKRTGLVNTLQAKYDLPNGLITLGPRNETNHQTFELRENNEKLNDYLSSYFDIKVYLLHRTRGELMDIPGASSVTIGEENLFKSPGIGMRFKLGNVEMIGVSPRARCNVPPRNPYTGETDKSFVKKMIASRDRSLPKESNLAKYGNTYHLTINTYLPDSELGKKIQVGDQLEILEAVNL